MKIVLRDEKQLEKFKKDSGIYIGAPLFFYAIGLFYAWFYSTGGLLSFCRGFLSGVRGIPIIGLTVDPVTSIFIPLMPLIIVAIPIGTMILFTGMILGEIIEFRRD